MTPTTNTVEIICNDAPEDFRMEFVMAVISLPKDKQIEFWKELKNNGIIEN